MPPPQSQPNRQTTNEAYNRLGQERERLRMRAIDLKRQRLVLENELASPGILADQSAFLSQRLQTLSNDEDQLSLKLAQTERQLQEAERSTKELEREQLGARLERQATLNAQTQQIAGLGVSSPETLKRVQRLTITYGRQSEGREKTYIRLSRQAKKAALLIVVVALIVAGLADILSIIDFGWLVSWSLPILTWFIVRRIRKINHSVDLIKTAQQAALAELRLLRQRLRPALASTGRAQLFVAADSLAIKMATTSYIRTFVRDQIIAQVVELIPVVDILPLYLGSVVKILIDQRKAYRQAKEALGPYRQTLDLLARLEQFDIQYQIGIIPNLRNAAPNRTPPRANPSTPRVAPVVRDISSPTMALSPA